jgi:RNA polymerase sigma-70 factor (ECF subfamily)
VAAEVDAGITAVTAPTTGTDLGARTSAVEDLLQLSAHGDRTAFARLYDVMAAPVYAMILARSTQVQQAERQLLAVFLGLWERCPLFPRRSHSAADWILAYAQQVVEYDDLHSSDER